MFNAAIIFGFLTPRSHLWSKFDQPLFNSNYRVSAPLPLLAPSPPVPLPLPSPPVPPPLPSLPAPLPPSLPLRSKLGNILRMILPKRQCRRKLQHAPSSGHPTSPPQRTISRLHTMNILDILEREPRMEFWDAFCIYFCSKQSRRFVKFHHHFSNSFSLLYYILDIIYYVSVILPDTYPRESTELLESFPISSV